MPDFSKGKLFFLSVVRCYLCLQQQSLDWRLGTRIVYIVLPGRPWCCEVLGSWLRLKSTFPLAFSYRFLFSCSGSWGFWVHPHKMMKPLYSFSSINVIVGNVPTALVMLSSLIQPPLALLTAFLKHVIPLATVILSCSLFIVLV